MAPTVSEVGNRYGTFTILKAVASKQTGAHWLGRCDCGAERTLRGACIRRSKPRCPQCEALRRGRMEEATAMYEELTTAVMRTLHIARRTLSGLPHPDNRVNLIRRYMARVMVAEFDVVTTGVLMERNHANIIRSIAHPECDEERFVREKVEAYRPRPTPPAPRDERKDFHATVAKYHGLGPEVREAFWASACERFFPNSHAAQAAMPPRAQAA